MPASSPVSLRLKGLMPNSKSRSSRSTAEQSLVPSHPQMLMPVHASQRNVNQSARAKHEVKAEPKEYARKRRLSGLSENARATPVAGQGRLGTPSGRPAVRQRTSSQSSVATIRRMPSHRDLREVLSGDSTVQEYKSPSPLYHPYAPKRPAPVPLRVEIPSAQQTSDIRSSNLFVLPVLAVRTSPANSPSSTEVLSVSNTVRGRAPFQSRIPLKSLSVKDVNISPVAFPTSARASAGPSPIRAVPPPVKSINSLLSRFDLSVVTTNKHQDFWDKGKGETLLWRGYLCVTDTEKSASARHPRPSCHSLELDCRTVGRDGRHARDTPSNPLFTTEYRGFHLSHTAPALEHVEQQHGIHVGRDWIADAEAGCWLVPFWVPLPSDLFHNVETRKFRVRAKMLFVEDADGARWAGGRTVPVYSGTTEFTLSHLRTRKEMGNVKTVAAAPGEGSGEGKLTPCPLDDPFASDGRTTPTPEWCLSDYSDDEQDEDDIPNFLSEEDGGAVLF